MATSRLDLRLSSDIKLKAERASELLGLKSLTEYIVNLIDEKSSQVLAEYENITIEDNIFDKFINACDQVKKPNKALLDAVSFTKEQSIK